MDNPSKLSDVLGIKANQESFVLHAPEGYKHIIKIPIFVDDTTDLPTKLDWLQAFYIDSQPLEAEISSLKNCLSKSGQLWISWPKKTSGVDSDLSDNVIRLIGIDSGLVDVKVVAIDEIWSGLKFVYRTGDR